MISVAAQIVGERTYTLRYYEKLGIIKPQRTEGNIRLYSDDDLAIIRKARSLMQDLGINLAGIEVILRMASQLSEIQKDRDNLVEEINQLRQMLEKDE